MHGLHGGRGLPRGHGMTRLSGPRARRGDIPAAVLALLNEGDMHGYQIIREISERTDGAWTPSPGSIYPALQLLEDQGMVTSTSIGGKRTFSLTEAGSTEAKKLPEDGPWAEFITETDPERKLRESFISLIQATKQISTVGSPEQIDRAASILSNARKSMYAMLGGE